MKPNRLALIVAGFTAALVMFGDTRPVRLACAAVLLACLMILARKRKLARQQ